MTSKIGTGTKKANLVPILTATNVGALFKRREIVQRPAAARVLVLHTRVRQRVVPEAGLRARASARVPGEQAKVLWVLKKKSIFYFTRFFFTFLIYFF
jgi:hypothetical protein